MHGHASDICEFPDATLQVDDSAEVGLAADYIGKRGCQQKPAKRWVQCAGHRGNFLPASDSTIWKRLSPNEPSEALIYSALSRHGLSDLAPQLHREVEHNGQVFLELENLLVRFDQPHLMDIKLGSRTFTEKEAQCPSLRADMYDRMIAISADEATPEEHSARAITKHRYLMFRSRESTTAELAFRISAYKKHDSPEPDAIALRRANCRADAVQVLADYVNHSACLSQRILDRLREIRQRLEASGFLRHHEMIGSSLLLLHDNQSTANVWLIDFAKVIHWESCHLDHRVDWVPGNHEEGYLTGLDTLIDVMQELTTQLVT